MYLSESQSEPSLVIMKVYSTKGTRKVRLLRTFVWRLAVSRSASMRRLTNFSSRDHSVLPQSIFLSFFYYYYYYYYYFDFLLAILRSQALGSLSPFPSPVRSEPTSLVRRETNPLYPLCFIRSNRNTPLESSPPCVTPELDKILLRKHRTFFAHVLDVTCNPPRIPLYTQPPWSFSLLHPRLGDPAGGCLADVNLVQSGIGAPVKNV